jgi:hypothetical protein
MNRFSRLQKSLVLIALILVVAIGHPFWWEPVSIALYVFYVQFAINLYSPIYRKENALTKFFFETTELPMCIAVATVVFAILYVKRFYPEANEYILFVNALAGGSVTLFARYKRGKLKTS